MQDYYIVLTSGSLVVVLFNIMNGVIVLVDFLAGCILTP